MPPGFLAKMLPKAGCVLCQSGLTDILLQWLPFHFCLQPGPLVEPRLMLAGESLPGNGRICGSQGSAFPFKYAFPLWPNMVSETP